MEGVRDPTATDGDPVGVEEAWGLAFLASSQVMLMLWVQGTL